MKFKYVGIDVGVNGGIAIIDDQGNLEVDAIPKIGTAVDLRELHNLIWSIGEGYPQNVSVVIEDVHSVSGSSAKSNFNFGRIAGILVGMVVACRYKFELVQPKIWQKEIWSTNDIIKRSTGKGTDTKATSLFAAKRLFPGKSFLATERSRVPHDGLVDAALLAEYCKRKFSV